MKFGTPLFVANWKMNMLGESARQYMRAFAKCFVPRSDGAVDAVFCPPYTAIAAVEEELRGKTGTAAGAQNIHWHDSGPQTGEVSPTMLAELGVKFAIVGHSERRMIYGETDEYVAKRAKAALAHGIVPIVCVGETLFYEHDDGEAFATVREQLKVSLGGIEKQEAGNLVVAYEPVWAIGTGRAATPEIVRKLHSFIRSELLQRFETAGAAIPILYGGSTTPENIGPIISEPNVGGALVGSTSLKPDQFVELIVRGRQAFQTPR